MDHYSICIVAMKLTGDITAESELLPCICSLILQGKQGINTIENVIGIIEGEEEPDRYGFPDSNICLSCTDTSIKH